MAISKLILNGEVQMDVTSDTVTAGSMLSGTTATKKDGTKATGTIVTKSSANLTASGSVVTAPAGYYSTAATKAVAAGSAFPPAVTITKAPTIGVNTSGVVTASYNGSSSITPTVTSGYVSQGTAGTISTTGTSTYQLTSKAAATYYPSTADQTIASQRWLVGAQTIKSVTTSNLTAENIAEGVTVKVGDSNNASRITQVTGTHSGAASYTATIGDSRFGATGSGNSTYCYVSLNGTKYYTYGGSFSFKAGDVLTIYCRGNYFIINGYEKSLSSYTYSYTLPDNDINIIMDYTNSSDNCIYIKDVPPNDAVSFWISYDETTWEPVPHCNKTYNECKQIITTTDAHAYCINSDANLLLTGVIISNGNAIRYRRYEGEQGDGVSEEFIYYSNGTISYTRNPISHLANINITSNGTYSSASTYYAEINVSVQGSGFTVDQIARRQISGSISGNATTIGSYAFANCTSLTNANFPSATYIGISAFASCTNLSTINGPSVSFIGPYAFMYCSKLTAASFPLASSINSYAFAYCDSLTTASFSLISVVASYVFRGCVNLSYISFPSVTFISDWAFGYCSSLTSVNFPLVSCVSNGAFNCCTQLATINFPSLTSLGASAFAYCHSLVTVSFPLITLLKNSTFAYCISLTTINFPLVTSTENSVFNGCYSLTSISFPVLQYIGNSVFAFCERLTTASFPALKDMMGGAFAYCSKLLSLYLLGSSVVYLGNANAFFSTPISDYTSYTNGVHGSIFVPASLYNSYITAYNWSRYSARIVSV